MNKKIDYDDHAFECYEGMEMRNIGTYRLVRSSEDENAMVHWSSLCIDEESGRWFEAAGGPYSGWGDSKLSIELNDMDIEEVHDDNPKLTARETHWDFLWGDVSEPVDADAYVWFYEYVEGKEYKYDLRIKDIPIAEIEEIKQAVYEWHRTGLFKYRTYIWDLRREL